MPKFEKIEVNGEYRFQAVNAAARKICARLGYGLIDARGMFAIIKETKGNLDFAW